MTNKSYIEALERLQADPRLKSLNDYVLPLRLFDALGVARDEIAHSRLLATLLDPHAHAGAESMLRALLAQVANGVETPKSLASTILGLPTKWNRISVRRELYRIDLVADILAPDGLVIGIENKIDAGEGDDQLSRYQDFLRDRFPNRIAILLFLTPTGRLPTTAATGHLVPCLPVSYADVLVALETARQGATNSRDAAALELVVNHLKEEIMGERDEAEKAARQLWREYPTALQLLLECRPRFSDMQRLYESLILTEFGPSIEFYYFPIARSEMREIKFSIPRWLEHFPFTFMLHAGTGSPQVRVLIYRDEFIQHANSLKKWAANTNAKMPGLIDEEFCTLPSWPVWHRVFKEADWPAEATITTGTYDDDTVRGAVERVRDLVAILRPHVDDPMCQTQ